MKTETIKTLLLIAFALIAGILATCEYNRPAEQKESTLQDTVFLSQWRREKAEKIRLIDSYTFKIQQLEQSQDNLKFSLAIHKDLLSAYRSKTKELRVQVQTNILKDTSHTVCKTIAPVVDSLIKFQQLSDSACDITINILEQEVANRDSSITAHINIETELKDLNKLEAQKTQITQEQLDSSQKTEKQLRRQNKLLKGAVFIISSLTTSLLILRTVK